MEKYLGFIKETFENSFDVVYRTLNYGSGEVTLIFIDNLCDANFISEFIIAPFFSNNIPLDSIEIIKTKVLRANAVGLVNSKEEALEHITSGNVILTFSSLDEVIFCDAKGFAKRSVDIPQTEAVLKGPREGLVESIADNIALIRKKIKSPDLKFELFNIGEKSNTAVAVGYIKGVAPEKLLNHVKNVLHKMKPPFILDTNYIEEEFGSSKSPFDTVGHSEKADIICSKILEGRVAVIVDGTPFIATVPHFFIENFQTPDDYYLNKFYANTTRILRWCSFLISTFLAPLYVAIITHHFSLIPSVFIFRLAVSRAGVPFPTVVEVFLMLTFFQIIKEAGIRLPQPIGQAMSIVGALILGDAATGAGLTSQTTVLIVALGSICYFLVPKLYGGSSLWSVILLLFAAFHGLPGFYLGFFMLITHLASQNSCDYPFLYPLGTFNIFKYKDKYFRADLDNISHNLLDEEDEQ